ncbi:hypothetical protein, partial [Bacteroides sp.]|uniref:hypothetical protein n=1 Tax=Bacteroides sp. TaxID=29523 RepID=UPI0025C26107
MIDIVEKKVPHSFRNKYLRRSGSGNVGSLLQPPTIVPSTTIDVIGIDSTSILTDRNVLSSLRALLEIRSRIIATDNTETEFS